MHFVGAFLFITFTKNINMKFSVVDYGIVLAIDEPITLSEAKSFMRIDADYASDDTQIELAISTARERLELHLNVGIVNRDITIEWVGSLLELPFTPNFEVIEVYDKDGVLDNDKYTIQGISSKRIFVGQKAGDYNYFYSMNNSYVEISSVNGFDCSETYTVKYKTGYKDNLPNAIKQSLLAETDYIYKLQGSPVNDIISPNAALLSAPYSKNLIL